jgi:molybdopterin converting factor small subunit
MIEVHLYGHLRRFAANAAVNTESIAQVAWHKGDTVADVLTRLGVDHAQVSNIFINGTYHYRAREMRLNDGDRLGIFPRNMCLLYC